MAGRGCGEEEGCAVGEGRVQVWVPSPWHHHQHHHWGENFTRPPTIPTTEAPGRKCGRWSMGEREDDTRTLLGRIAPKHLKDGHQEVAKVHEGWRLGTLVGRKVQCVRTQHKHQRSLLGRRTNRQTNTRRIIMIYYPPVKFASFPQCYCCWWWCCCFPWAFSFLLIIVVVADVKGLWLLLLLLLQLDLTCSLSQRKL